MSRTALSLSAIAFAIAALPATASEELAKKYACTACHAIDKKGVGPAYKDVAKKYAADKNAKATLVAKVKAGGVGNWGQVPMPPNATVPDADIDKLVAWVLSLK